MYPFHFIIRTLKLGKDEAVLVCIGSVFQIIGAWYINEFRPCRVDFKDDKSNFEFLVGMIRSFK